MKKILVTILVVGALIYGFSMLNDESDKSVIKIGVVATLDGPGAIFGKSAVKAIQMAQNEMDDTDKKYSLIIEDDNGNAAKSASAAQKLINIDKVDAIISISSLAGNAVKPIAESAGVPHVCNCSDLSISDTKTGFIFSVLPDDEAIRWLKEAQNRGVKKVAILSQNHPGVNITIDNVIKNAAEYGIEIVSHEKFDSQVRDFKTSIVKAKIQKPDLYMVAMFPPLLEIASKELVDFGENNISSYAMFGASTDISMFEGKWYTDTYLENMDFITRFQREFPEVRFSARTAPIAYDIFNLLVDGFETDTNIIEYLSSTQQFSGQSGQTKQEPGSHAFRVPAGVWEIKDTKSIILNK